MLNYKLGVKIDIFEFDGLKLFKMCYQTFETLIYFFSINIPVNLMGENWLNFAIVLVIVPGAKCYPNSINPIDVQTKPKILVNHNLVIKSIFKGGVEIIFFFFLG